MSRAVSLLRSISTYSQTTSGVRSLRLAVVDPAYDPATFPATWPRVTFEGETSLSGKRFPVVGVYLPSPSDRIVLAWVGGTWAILGSLDSDASAHIGGTIVRDTWHTATLENGWTNAGSDLTCQYTKVASPAGVYVVAGGLTPGTKTDSTTVLTLPVGYRPAANLSFPIYAASGSNPRFDCTTGGVMRCYGCSAATFAAFQVYIPVS